MKKIILLFALLVVSVSSALAVIAYPNRVLFRQPNSEITLTVFLKGDERVHWAETEDGYSLVHDSEGHFVYAQRDENGDMVASEFIATDVKDRPQEVIDFLAATPKHILFSQSQVDGMLEIWNIVEKASTHPKTMSDVRGKKRFLVILFQFQDVRFTWGRQAFVNLFNQVNYSANGAFGSVHDYYYEVSQGLFSLSVDVVGPYTGVNEMAHYGNTNRGYQDFAREAVRNAAADVDFSNYDNDKDGHIDGLHIIFAGHGEEAGASADAIWSHKSSIANAPRYNNTVVDVYSCSPECSGNIGTELTAIGVICHELGHVFGAPDFYDTDYANSGGNYPALGQWDIMSSGSWNNSGRCPANHNPYTKLYIYNWAVADTLTDSCMLTLDAAMQSNNDFYRINTSTQGDFFLLENRQHIKWDRYVPGHGLLVYHLHPNAHGASVSNSTHPQQMYILGNVSAFDTFPTAQVSSYGLVNSAGTPKPGSTRLDSLTDNSVPALRPWSRVPNNTPLTYIQENTETGRIYLCFKGAVPRSLSFNGDVLTNTSVSLNWESYGSSPVIILINTSNRFDSIVPSLSVNDTLSDSSRVVYRGTGSQFTVENLTPGTTYYFCMVPILKGECIAPRYLSLTTLDCDANVWNKELFEGVAAGSLPQCWEGSGWNVVEGISVEGSKSMRGFATENGTAILQMMPFKHDSVGNMVLAMMVNADSLGDAAELTISYRNVHNSQWSAVQSLSKSQFSDGGWQRVYAPLPDVDEYSVVRLELAGGASVVYIDSVELLHNCLVFASSTENGAIYPSGYLLAEEGDSILFTLRAYANVTLRELTVDDESVSVTASRNPEYRLVVTGHHNVFARFSGLNGISTADDSQLQVYPNPTNGRFNVQIEHNQHLYIFDVNGKKVYEKKNCEGNVAVDITHLPDGMYIIKCGSEAVKIIKR